MEETQEINQNEFAEFLKNKRTALGLSLREFSMFIYGRKSQFKHLNDLENGLKAPSYKTMTYILNKLNCKLIFDEM